MFEIIWIILIGAVVGALAKLVMPGPDPGGFWLTAVLGIVGAVVATLLGRLMGLYEAGQGAGFIASFIGAIIVLAVHRKFQKGSSTAR